MPVAHQPIESAATIPSEDEPTLKHTLSFTAVPLPRRTILARVELRHVHAVGQTLLYGVALFDSATGNVAAVDPRGPLPADLPRRAGRHLRECERLPSRVRRAGGRRWCRTGPTALSRLRDGALDPRRQVVVEGQPPNGAGPFKGTPPADATIVGEANASIELRAEAAGGGFLVLTDPYYPGWRAYVDGIETTILRADYLFRAVPVGPGSHNVTFQFSPATLAVGAQLSVAGVLIVAAGVLVGMVGWLVASLLRRRRRAAPAA